jgi:hypothetical protein
VKDGENAGKCKELHMRIVGYGLFQSSFPLSALFQKHFFQARHNGAQLKAQLLRRLRQEDCKRKNPKLFLLVFTSISK